MATTLPVQEKQNMSLLRSWKLWAELGLLALLCVSQYLSISIVNLALTGCILLVMFIMDRIEECTAALFMAVPMFNLLNYRVGNISMYYLLVFIFWFRYFEHYQWSISREKLLILLIFLVLRLFAMPDLKALATWFVLFSVLVLSYREDFFEKNLPAMIFYLTAAFLLSSAAGYLMQQAGSSIYAHGYVWSEDGSTTRFAGLIGDAVFYSQFCALLVAANLAIGCYHPRLFWRNFILSIALAAFCVLTFAKTGTALVIVLFAVSILWQIRMKASSRKTFLISLFLTVLGIAAAGAGIAYILSDPDNDIVQKFLIRLQRKDLLTGRLDIWAHYFFLITEHWQALLLPIPYSTMEAGVYLSTNSLFTATHNVFLEMLCFFGILPTIFIVSWVLYRIYQSFIQKNGILMLMPIAVMIASGMTLHGNEEFHYYTLVAISLSFLNLDKDDFKKGYSI